MLSAKLTMARADKAGASEGLVSRRGIESTSRPIVPHNRITPSSREVAF